MALFLGPAPKSGVPHRYRDDTDPVPEFAVGNGAAGRHRANEDETTRRIPVANSLA